MNLQSREGLEHESTGRLGAEAARAGGATVSIHARRQAAAAELAAAVPALKALAHAPRPAPTAEQWKAFSAGLDARMNAQGARATTGLAARLRAATGPDRRAADTRLRRATRRGIAAALAALAAWAAFEWLTPAHRAAPALGMAISPRSAAARA